MASGRRLCDYVSENLFITHGVIARLIERVKL
jgi:hypothetical protein